MALESTMKKRWENLDRHRSFRTKVSAFRFCDVAFYRLQIMCFFMFSRTNLLSIVDRLAKKTETKKDVIVPKKQVCRRRQDFRARRKLQNWVTDRNIEESRGRFSTRFPLSPRFIHFKPFAHSDIWSKFIPVPFLDVYASTFGEKNYGLPSWVRSTNAILFISRSSSIAWIPGETVGCE